jgi:hypothetical protein
MLGKKAKRTAAIASRLRQEFVEKGYSGEK